MSPLPWDRIHRLGGGLQLPILPRLPRLNRLISLAELRVLQSANRSLTAISVTGTGLTVQENRMAVRSMSQTRNLKLKLKIQQLRSIQLLHGYHQAVSYTHLRAHETD